MNKSKRQFLKLVAFSVASIPVISYAGGSRGKDSGNGTVSRSNAVPQSKFGGGMTGVDFSRYYKKPTSS